MFAVLRFQKLKSRGEIAAMMSHWQRTKPTPNADPRRGVEPLLGSCQEGDVTWLLPKKYRSNAVLAVEGVLSASPQYFRPDHPARAGHYDPARTAAWVASSMTWLKAEFGDRLVSAILHLDEATPHIHCAVVPVTPKGTLCAREMFNPNALRRMQTNYGEALAPLGIKRGRESSTADHIEVGRYYHRVSKATEPLPQVSAAELATMKLFGRVPASIAELQARAIDGVQARAEVDQLRTDAAKPAQAAEITKQERQDLQNRLRAIPLTEVLPRLGYVRDPKARQGDWRGPAGRLTLADAVDGKPETFRLNDLADSGRGAIDLVMKTEGITFQAAVGWLCAERTTQEAVATAAACAEAAAEEAVKQVVAQGGPKMVPLSLDPEHVAAVSSYLVHERSLPQELIQPLIADQSIQAAPAAGRFVNAAFRLYPGEKVGLAANRVGVRLQSTQASYVYRGIRGERGVWNFTDPGAQPGGREVVVIGQSPISVLSVCALMRKQQGILPPLEAEDIGDVVFVATEGAAKEQVRKVVRAAHARGSEVVTAFDPNASGRSLERVVYEEAKVMKARVARISDLVVLAGQHLTGFADLWVLLVQEGARTLQERIEKGRILRRQGHGTQELGPVPRSSEHNL